MHLNFSRRGEPNQRFPSKDDQQGAPGCWEMSPLKKQLQSPFRADMRRRSHVIVKTPADGGSLIQGRTSDDDSQSLQSEFKYAFSEGLRTWEHRKASRGVDSPSRRKPASRFQEVEGALQTVPTYTRLSPGGHGGFDSGGRQSSVLSGSGAFHPTEPKSRLTYLQPCEHWLRLPSRASSRRRTRDTALPGLAQRPTLSSWDA